MQGDIDQLRAAGYSDKVTAGDLRNPLSALSIAAHSIDNFAPDHPSTTSSDLSPENEARARAHSQAIGLFREDVQALRSNTLSLPLELIQKKDTAQHLAIEALSATTHGDLHQAGKIADLAEHRVIENVHHALDTITHTEQLGMKVFDHADADIDFMSATWRAFAADQLKHGIKDVSDGAQLAGHKIGQAWHATSRSMDAATDALATKTMQSVAATRLAAQHAVQDVEQTIDATLERLQQTIDRFDRSLHESPTLPPLPPTRLDDVTHPDHAMYLQARKGVHKLDAEHDRTPDQRSDQLAAALVVAARREGLTRIDQVTLHHDAEHISVWEHASPDSDWLTNYLRKTNAEVPTLQSLNTPIEQSSQAWEQTMQLKQAERAQAHERQIQQQQEPTAKQSDRGFAR